MTAILVVMYAFYFILVGAEGNANQFLSLVGGEQQFLYWIVVMLVVAALWDSDLAPNLARAFAALIVIGFLLSHNNGLTIIQNAKAILPAL